MTTVLIVGGGLAAARSVANLKARGCDGKIVVATDETTMPYNRPPLSKEFLRGDLTSSDLSLVTDELQAGVEWKLGARAVSSDLNARTVTLDSGEQLSFDGLVIATGVSSRRLPIPGPTQGRTVLRSYSDAVHLKSRLTPGSRVIGLGAGFIGCEVARTAIDQGCTVDIVAIDETPMAMPLGEQIGAEIQRRHEAAGVRFHMGKTVAETVGNEKVERVLLSDGTQLEADVLLETVGSVPNVDWLRDNDLDLDNGVLTDEHLRAGGRAAIVAVGDVARFANPMFSSTPQRIEHWQTAIDTAAVATATLAYDLGLTNEEPEAVNLMPWFWSDQGNVRLTSYGQLGIADSTEIVEGSLEEDCAVRYSRGGETVGYLLLGMKSKGARYKRALLKERKALVS